MGKKIFIAASAGRTDLHVLVKDNKTGDLSHTEIMRKDLRHFHAAMLDGKVTYCISNDYFAVLI